MGLLKIQIREFGNLWGFFCNCMYIQNMEKIFAKIEPLIPVVRHYPHKILHKEVSISFVVIAKTDRQQTMQHYLYRIGHM